MKSILCFCPILTKCLVSQHIFIEVLHIKFHGNPCGGSQSETQQSYEKFFAIMQIYLKKKPPPHRMCIIFREPYWNISLLLGSADYISVWAYCYSIRRTFADHLTLLWQWNPVASILLGMQVRWENKCIQCNCRLLPQPIGANFKGLTGSPETLEQKYHSMHR